MFSANFRRPSPTTDQTLGGILFTECFELGAYESIFVFKRFQCFVSLRFHGVSSLS